VTDIKPRIMDGEPVCNGCECPAFSAPPGAFNTWCQIGRVPAQAWTGGRCIPGLRRQRDEALAKVARLRSGIDPFISRAKLAREVSTTAKNRDRMDIVIEWLYEARAALTAKEPTP